MGWRALAQALPHYPMVVNPNDANAANAPDFFDEGQLAAVWTTQPLGRRLDYKAPEGGCWRGAFVEVPLGPRKVIGVVNPKSCSKSSRTSKSV